METITLRVNAKINLSLNVTGTSGNYHELDTVMTSVELADTLVLRKANGVTVRFNGVEAASSNASKAARLTCEHFHLGGVEIDVTPNIPEGWGLGGSSGDAAGVIRGVVALYGVSASDDELRSIAMLVGSDVPYMLSGGYARMRGVGTGVERFDAACGYVLIVGKGSVNTGECFRTFDALKNSGVVCDNDEVVSTLIGGGLNALKNPKNALYAAASTLNPHISKMMELLSERGLTACMTGSGSGVFAIGAQAELKQAMELMRKNGYECMVVRTLENGINIY